MAIPLTPATPVEPLVARRSEPTPVVAAKHAHLDDQAHVLPLGADAHPEAQEKRLAEAPDHKVDAQIEKVKGDEREEQGEDAEGTIVDGLEDDKLWALIRRFNVVCSLDIIATVGVLSLTRLAHSKSTTPSRRRRSCRRGSPTCAQPPCLMCRSTRTFSNRTANACSRRPESGPSTLGAK